MTRAQALQRYIVANAMSRFADELATPAPESVSKLVVVVVPPDATNPNARSQERASLQTLVERALREHPDAILGLLPETTPLSGRAPRIPENLLRNPRILRLANDVDHSQLLARAVHVYTIASLFGFEALLYKVPVTVFGEPFYAGWGLTRDLSPNVRRARTRNLDELVAAALLLVPNYLDPVRQRQSTAEDTLQLLSLQRTRFLENRGRFFCAGFSIWKRAIIKAYLASNGNEISFVRNAATLPKVVSAANSKLVVWASRPHEDVAQFAKSSNIPLWRVEDGFLRSVGLGSDWAAPGSLVFDPMGIYYDPRQPSNLEILLETAEFTDEELVQAEELRTLIIALRISKYNTLTDREYCPRNRTGQKVILVPGQVADDASVRFGGTSIGSIGNLLQTVRTNAPDAYILYKPHPDVLSGNRQGHVNEGLGTWFDELIVDVPIARCLECVDEVQTISSLVGFEALLRQLPVVCHGQPFYAGWGLTRDLSPIPRRTRELTLPMLVAGTLMRYPRYYHFPSGCFCSAAQMADAISTARRTIAPSQRQPKLVRRVRSLFQLVKDLGCVG
jgi:capsular polysaccharide export protein